MTNLDSILKSRDISLSTKVHLVKPMVFPVVVYGCESWTINKAERRRCFWTVVLVKTLESPLYCKEIVPVHPKGDQSWVFIGRTDVEAEVPILWPPDAKSWLIWKNPDAGKDWGQEQKGMTEDKMVGWHPSLTRWTWVWVNSRSWRWTGRPGVLQFMGSQRAGHDRATELMYVELFSMFSYWSFSLLCSICSGNPCWHLILDICVFSLFLCLFYQFYWSFREQGFASFIFSIFSVIDFCSYLLLFLFSWLLWLYFPLPSFLRWEYSTNLRLFLFFFLLM